MHHKVYKIYHERFEKFTQQVNATKTQIVYLSSLRFLSFIASVFLFILTIKDYHIIKLASALILLALFIYLVIKFVKLTDKLKHYKNLVKLNSEEKQVLQYKFGFFDSGKEFIDREHPYSFDLDLFGDGSMFQYLNRTVTLVGKNLLAKRLLNMSNSKHQIEIWQEAIREMSPEIDWRQNFIATGYAYPIGKDDNKKINFWVDKPAYFISKKFFKVLVIALPAVTLTLLALVLTGLTHYSWFVLFALLQLFIASMMLRRTNHEQELVSKELKILKNYSMLIELIENKGFHADYLINLQQNLKTGNDYAKTAFKKLIRIIDAFDTRLNIFLGIILNATLMWDLYSIMRLEKWKLKYGKNLKNWILVISEFDVLCSLANYSFNNPDYIYPVIDEETIIQTKDIGHPLIPGSKRVNNDFSLTAPGEIDITTGANMAGKSTFLRTIGINLVLAMNGLPVAAKDFRFRVMNIFSGMRTADSLTDNESYFFAELKRLKSAIEALKKGELTFLLLDEILKGTNSVDKAKGSWKFVEHLVKLNATGIVATHDLTLCDLEKEYPEKIKNKCFEVEINGDEIKFDYKLRNGVTKNMNASILMKKMGLFSN